MTYYFTVWVMTELSNKTANMSSNGFLYDDVPPTGSMCDGNDAIAAVLMRK